jgi:hypothetical protein
MIFLAALAASGSAAGSDTLRCGSHLVSTGDTKVEVLIKCGAPAWKDTWTDEVIDGIDATLGRAVSVGRERWVYNFGPNAFLEFLSFDNDRLTGITAGSYGYSESPPSARSCNPEQFNNGLSQYEVLQRCGEPFFKDSHYERRLSVVKHGVSRLADLRVDEWTYNLGPTQFLRILKFENGRLMSVTTGDRGF